MKIKKALGIVSNNYREPEVCESCGAKFQCGISLTGCWCMKVKLDDDQRSELKTKYKKCLCPKCLDAVLAGRTV